MLFLSIRNVTQSRGEATKCESTLIRVICFLEYFAGTSQLYCVQQKRLGTEKYIFPAQHSCCTLETISHALVLSDFCEDIATLQAIIALIHRCTIHAHVSITKNSANWRGLERSADDRFFDVSNLICTIYPSVVMTKSIHPRPDRAIGTVWKCHLEIPSFRVKDIGDFLIRIACSKRAGLLSIYDHRKYCTTPGLWSESQADCLKSIHHACYIGSSLTNRASHLGQRTELIKPIVNCHLRFPPHLVSSVSGDIYTSSDQNIIQTQGVFLLDAFKITRSWFACWTYCCKLVLPFLFCKFNASLRLDHLLSASIFVVNCLVRWTVSLECTCLENNVVHAPALRYATFHVNHRMLHMIFHRVLVAQYSIVVEGSSFRQIPSQDATETTLRQERMCNGPTACIA